MTMALFYIIDLQKYLLQVIIVSCIFDEVDNSGIVIHMKMIHIPHSFCVFFAISKVFFNVLW